MPARGTKPKDDDRKRNRNRPTHDWIDVDDKPYRGKVPVQLPARRELMGPKGPVTVPVTALTKKWWTMVRRMPHCALWTESDWWFALETALVHDLATRGITSANAELRQREKILGTTLDARRDLRIRYVKPEPAKAPAKRASAKKKPAGGTVTSLDDRRRQLTSAS